MTTALTAELVLAHWQGHRRLTRRMIEAFPEDKLFSFCVGGMRPFSELAMEFIKMAAPIVRNVATGKWASFDWLSGINQRKKWTPSGRRFPLTVSLRSIRPSASGKTAESAQSCTPLTTRSTIAVKYSLLTELP